MTGCSDVLSEWRFGPSCAEDAAADVAASPIASMAAVIVVIVVVVVDIVGVGKVAAVVGKVVVDVDVAGKPALEAALVFAIERTTISVSARELIVVNALDLTECVALRSLTAHRSSCRSSSSNRIWKLIEVAIGRGLCMIGG